MNFGAIYVNEDVISNIVNVLSEDSSDMFFIVAKCAYKVLSKNEEYNRYREKCRAIINHARSYAAEDLNFYVFDRNGISAEENEIVYQIYPNEKKGFDNIFMKFVINPKRVIRVLHDVIRIKEYSNLISDMIIYELEDFHLEYHIDENKIY